MTDKPTPTDAEILDAAEDFRSQYTHGGTTFDEFDEIGFARAVLAKWGQPVVAGDVDRADAVNLARNALTQYDCAITKKGVRVLAEAVLSMDSALTTPQPTQAQAAEPVAWLDPWTGAKVTTDYDAYGKHGIPLVRQQPVALEPLTPEQIDQAIAELGLNYLADAHATNRAVLRKLCHHAHGIKGGQHVS